MMCSPRVRQGGIISVNFDFDAFGNLISILSWQIVSSCLCSRCFINILHPLDIYLKP